MLSTSVGSLRVLGISMQCLSDHSYLLSRKPTIGTWRADERSTGLQYRTNVDTKPVVTTPKQELPIFECFIRPSAQLGLFDQYLQRFTI
jgi:hypothetical protein